MTDKPHPTQVFTPGAPIDRRAFFAGRNQQIARVVDTIPSPGRHPIIFGQRGVGKTSLANILGELLPDIYPVKISCDSSDSFASIWDRIMARATLSFKRKALGLTSREIEEKTSLRAFVGEADTIGPSQVTDVLALLRSPAVFILDEFDRVSDERAKAQMADLVKNVSDNNKNVTIVLVGVSDSIVHLIGEHPSVQRNLVQIELPPMDDEEIRTIVDNGCQRLQIHVDEPVLAEVTQLAYGFPHYAHLLGLSIARACEIQETDSINLQLFRSLACKLAIEDAIETYRNAFSRATRTSKPSRYPKILCACAFAHHDEDGVFRATDVVDAMREVFDEDLTVPAVVPALGEFCSADRGPILIKVPVGDRSHYRFADPMMRPFLRIRTRGF